MAAGQVEFTVHIRPGGRQNAVEGEFDGALAVRVVAPPADGKANAAVVKLLAQSFGVARRDVVIVSGTTARRKRIRIAGDPGTLQAELLRLMGGSGGAKTDQLSR